MSEAILDEPDFLRELHKIREELAKQTRKEALKELQAVRERHRKRLGNLYIEPKKAKNLLHSS